LKDATPSSIGYIDLHPTGRGKDHQKSNLGSIKTIKMKDASHGCTCTTPRECKQNHPQKRKIPLGFSHENTDLDNSNSTGKMLMYANARNGKIMKAQEPDSLKPNTQSVIIRPRRRTTTPWPSARNFQRRSWRIDMIPILNQGSRYVRVIELVGRNVARSLEPGSLV
jgi:hypothetical protein